jgi:hypothetical protein
MPMTDAQDAPYESHLHQRERALRARKRDALEAEGVPDLLDTLPGKELTGDAQEGLVPPGDAPQLSDDPSLTEPGQGHPVPLDAALAREAGRGGASGPDPGATGRLLADDVRATDGMTAAEADLDASDLSAEEAAVHVVDRP